MLVRSARSSLCPRKTARYLTEPTYQIDFDDKWLADDDWKLPVYEVDALESGTTLVELQKLRVVITDNAIEHFT